MGLPPTRPSRAPSRCPAPARPLSLPQPAAAGAASADLPADMPIADLQNIDPLRRSACPGHHSDRRRPAKAAGRRCS
eukprot:11376890-Alexandrium_andersonii.AAC.1